MTANDDDDSEHRSFTSVKVGLLQFKINLFTYVISTSVA